MTIGLTGGIGSGKSTVAQWFELQGVPVVDADKTVHRLLRSDLPTIEKLVREFGQEVLAPNGEINRSELGRRVFGDVDARKRLERIVHPRVLECMQEERHVLQNTGLDICVWDVPLLLESGYDRYVDQIWVVWVSRDVQLRRVLIRDKLKPEEVEARIFAQKSLDEKCQYADVVIDNSGDFLETRRQIERAWAELLRHNNIEDANILRT